MENFKLLKFPKGMTLNSTEELFYENRNGISENNEILLDFSEVTFIEVGSFFYLLTFILSARKNNVEILIKWSKSRKVRDIFRAWRFNKVLLEITKQPFEDYLVEEDWDYLWERDISDRFYDIMAKYESGMVNLIKSEFFALFNLPFENKENKLDTLAQQPKHWENEYIKAVLKEHLEHYDDSNEKLLPRVVIYESLTNAYRHPKADLLITGSFFDKKSNLLTINYWDNGNSIYSTLREALDNNIKAEFDEKRFERLHATYYLKYVDDNGEIHFPHFVNSNMIPSSKASNERLLLSSFFPGISCDPEGKTRFSNQDLSVNSPGMGLTFLLQVVINEFKGSVSVRTKDYFINISSPLSQKRKSDITKYLDHIKEHKTQGKCVFDNIYKCKIETRLNSGSYFFGNMITIRLPLKK